MVSLGLLYTTHGSVPEASLSDETLAIVGVGLALAAFVWRILTSMEARLVKRIERSEGQLTDVRERVARLEAVFGHVFRKEAIEE